VAETNVKGNVSKNTRGTPGPIGKAFEYTDFTENQLKGLKGDKGEPFKYEDFTEEQLAKLKGEKGDTGIQGDKGEQGVQGIQGVQGEKGEAFTYEDFTPEQLANLKGEKGDTGLQGERGYTPSLVLKYNPETGELSYSSDGILIDKEYVETQNLISRTEFEAKLLEISNKVAPSPASVTLYADRWEYNEEEKIWYQEVEVANATITTNSKVNIQINAEQVEMFRGMTLWAENEGGIITVCCSGGVPEENCVLQSTVSEAIVNE
jgi:hypothetical protein